MHISTAGLVLSSKKFQEDRLITVLTGESGIISAYAGGAARNRGKLVSSTEFLCYSRFVFFKNRDKYAVDSAETEKVFSELRKDVVKLSLANHFAQLVSKLAASDEHPKEHLRLLLNALYFLEKAEADVTLLKAVYELRALTLAGFMPDLVACASCGSFEEKPHIFLPAVGEIFCEDCAKNFVRERQNYIPLSASVLKAMRFIIYSAPEKLFKFKLASASAKELAGAVESYLRFCMDAAMPALDFYYSL